MIRTERHTVYSYSLSYDFPLLGSRTEEEMGALGKKTLEKIIVGFLRDLKIILDIEK